jgi:hypothetical protein
MNFNPQERGGHLDADMLMDKRDQLVLRRLLEESSRERIVRTGETVRQQVHREVLRDLDSWSGID